MSADADADAESMTVLRCRYGHRATKRWHVDPATGELLCDGYDAGYRFAVTEYAVAGIHEVGRLIDQVRRDPRNFLVMGEPLPDVDLRDCQRLLYQHKDGTPPSFRAVPRRWLSLDFDDVPGPFAFDTADAELAALYCRTKLPSEFHRASLVYQTTSSAGFKHGCRVRLFFWLDRAITPAEAARWLSRCPVAPSVRRPVQPIYVADPTLERGVSDPVKGERFGIVDDQADVVTVPELPEPKVQPITPLHAPDGRRYVSGDSTTTAGKRLEALCRGIRQATKGNRHRTMMWAAARAVELDDALSRGEIADALLDAMRCHSDITESDDDLRRQIKNGFRIGVFGCGAAA